jgi:hypothetical protein
MTAVKEPPLRYKYTAFKSHKYIELAKILFGDLPKVLRN